MSYRKLAVWMILMMMVWLMGGGCTDTVPAGSDAPGRRAEDVSQPKAPANNKVTITVYFATKDAIYLAPETATLDKPANPVQSAMELLMAGPKNKDLLPVIPPVAKLISIKVKDKIAYVNFNDKLKKQNPGGSTNEILTIGAIVNTLTEFPEIKKVQILIDGKVVQTLSGHLDISEPLSRSEGIIKQPVKK
ncbi:GerMN domain-containing protein [Acetonema longum]|uniref:Lipoprotein LpqB, GerMN domain protein n=1 Tax=Acetonema longum DSM 6540 TaxID=1009370 RepID=F7NI56_9FIRM|nr:GerMN domain-containing protein [Acetonema longum]EGO64288.1 Lipoprotein LpqB, GerMN domain protein [Acetonema longum DSM 6540]